MMNRLATANVRTCRRECDDKELQISNQITGDLWGRESWDSELEEKKISNRNGGWVTSRDEQR